MRTPTTQQHASLAPLIPLRTLSATDWLVALCLTTAYLAFMLSIQQPTSINAGQGWDGRYYYQMAMGDNLADIYPPFALRFGLPWLASHFPTPDIFLNFKLINLACALLYMAGCYILLALGSRDMHAAVPIIGWLLVCTGNLAPVPSVLWYPLQTDIACNLLALVFLTMVITGRLSLPAIALLFFTGTVMRENFPEFLAYSFLGLHVTYDKQLPIRQNLSLLAKANRVTFSIIAVGLLASLAGLYTIALYTGLNPVENKLPDILSATGKYLSNPLLFFAVITNAISAVLLIPAAAACSRTPARHAHHVLGLPCSTLLILVFGLIAMTSGSNPERFWYWTMPFFALCILPAIDVLLAGKRYLALGACLLWTLFIQRSLVPIDPAGIKQDCGLLAILTGHSNWIGHWSDQCNRVSQQHLVVLATVAMLAVVIVSLAENFLRDKRHD